MENIPAENVEMLDVFYYSGLKKWTASVAFSVNGKHYVASMDILEKWAGIQVPAEGEK